MRVTYDLERLAAAIDISTWPDDFHAAKNVYHAQFCSMSYGDVLCIGPEHSKRAGVRHVHNDQEYSWLVCIRCSRLESSLRVYYPALHETLINHKQRLAHAAQAEAYRRAVREGQRQSEDNTE